MATKTAASKKDSIHRASEYKAISSVCIASCIDILISKLETAYANFPVSVRNYSNAKGDIFNGSYEGIGTVKGEQSYLNWLIVGLLNLMDEAKSQGHVTDATRFAFEAGLLWSMSNHAKARRTQDQIEHQLVKRRRLAKDSRATEAGRIAELIRKEVADILRGSPVKTTSTSARQSLARKTHFADGTPMVSLRTINAAFSNGDKRKPKNR